MKVVVASDHAGYEVKEKIKKILDDMNLTYEDLGTDSTEAVDYPDFAARVATAVSEGQADRGVLVCGTGIGVSIAANKYRGVRAALCHNAETARLSREHNDANVLAVGARTTPLEDIDAAVRTFFTTEFAGGRHARRVEKINQIEENNGLSTNAENVS